jgi:hypothetical protein
MKSQSRPNIGQNILGRQVALEGVSSLVQNTSKILSKGAVDCEVEEAFGE